MAALPSVDTVGGSGWLDANGVTASCIRSRASPVAAMSAAVSGAPSTRLTTSSTGAWSPSGNWRARLAICAESESTGTNCGAWAAAAFSPINTMKPMPSSTAASAHRHERRSVTQLARASDICPTISEN